MYIKSFNEISKKDINLAGGKGASLGEMVNAGIPVPLGFVITAEGFEKDIKKEILNAFDGLSTDRVAVRSSAVAEDSSEASWAGQLETYLNISKEDLINKVKECWDSIKSERAQTYAIGQNLSEEQLKVAVVVQKMIDSEASGVMFTVNPVTKNRNEIMIEAGLGLGEMIVQGLITPDNFVVNKENLEIKSSDIEIQEAMLVFKDGNNQEIAVPDDRKSQQKISDGMIKELANYGLKIEKYYGFPQDIEWAIDKEDRIWILQSRPITTL